MKRNAILKYQKGSTLVGAVILGLVFAITGVTYLLVVRHTGEQESDAQREYRALYAAESGLLVGTRILSQNGLSSDPQAWVIPPTDRLEMNQLWVDVEQVDYSGSSFWSGSSASSAPTRIKKVNARAYTAQTGGEFVKRVSWLVGEVAAFDFGYFSNGLGNNGQGELCGNNFFGKVYLTAKSSGNPLNPVCTQALCSYYYGDVSFSATMVNTTGGHCKYDSTEILNGQDPLYTLLQAPVMVPDNYKYMATAIRASSNPNKVLLSGTGTLVFNPDGSATFGATTFPSIEGLIFVASNNINVQGTVKGNATVVGAANKRITITGDLKYASLNVTGDAPPLPPTSIPSGSGDYLGLVSDGGVTVENSVERHVSASIIAWDDGQPGLSKTSNQRITLTGTLLQAESSTDFYPMDFVHDERFKNHAPPGFPPVGMVDNLYKFEIRNWEESSVN